MTNSKLIYRREAIDINDFDSGTLEYNGKEYKLTEEHGKIHYWGVMENGELIEDFGIEKEIKKRSLLDKVYSKIDNHIRKFVFKHSYIPETDVVRIGDAVFIDKSTKNKKEYEFSHFEK